MSEHLTAEIVRPDAADEQTLAGASGRGDRLVRAFSAGVKRDAFPNHRLADARMPLARGDDIHVDRAEDDNAGHALVHSRTTGSLTCTRRVVGGDGLEPPT